MFQLEKFLGGLVKGSGKKDKKTGKSSKRFLEDSLKVSLLIATTVILIIYLIFRNSIDEDENFFGLMLKAGLFVLIAVSAGVFMHSKHLEHVYEDKYSDKSAKETVDRGTARDNDDLTLTDLAGDRADDRADDRTTGGRAGEHVNSSGARESNDIDVHVSISGNSHKTIPKSGAFDPPKSSNIE